MNDLEGKSATDFVCNMKLMTMNENLKKKLKYYLITPLKLNSYSNV